MQSPCTFTQTASQWLTANDELLIASVYGAGDRDYLLCRSLDDINWFCENTATGYPVFSICLYADPKLPIRGVVDSDFIASAITSLPNGKSVLVLHLDRFRDRLLLGNFCDDHSELKTELEDCSNCGVAVGLLDDWSDTDARSPDEKRFLNGTIKRGA